jgi:two-component system response regulator AtoC
METTNDEIDTTNVDIDIDKISEGLSFVAASAAMRKIRAQAELLAKVDGPILILGESGSGKEVAARLIHKVSARSGYRFLKVNCAGLASDLPENELFGYEGDAAIGATEMNTGRFGLCDKGTVLLDEVTEMPARHQAKLLYLLQDKQLRGSRVDVDVRILSATSVNIEKALAEKRLREDLYYHLSTFTVHLPPLRERRDELQVLLGYFMNRTARRYGLPPRFFSDALLAACQHYSWPGNLRELENFVKRYLVMGDEPVALSELRPKDGFRLAEEVRQGRPLEPASRKDGDNSEDANGLKSLLRSIKGEAEKHAILSTLAKTGWNRKEAARLLSISYRGLLYKIEQYQLTPPPSYFSPLAKNRAWRNEQGH